MAKVIPFRGLRYNTEMFQDLNAVIAPSHDMISPAEQQVLYDKNEYNVVRLDTGMDFETDDETNNRYTRSAAYLKQWILENQLQFEEKPAFYIYEQIFSLGKEAPTHSLKGIVGLVQLEDFSQRVVLPNEEKMEKVKEDRLKLLQATGTNISQIYSLFMDEEQAVARLLEEQSDRKPDLSFVTDENITQKVWIVTDEKIHARISALFQEKQILIADGHYRYETALSYSKLRHEEDASEVGSKPYDYVMMNLVSLSDGGLFVFPTHRMIRGVEGFEEVLLIGALTEQFTVSKIYFTEGDYAEIITDRLANTVDETLFGFYTGQNYYYLLKLKEPDALNETISGKSDAYKHLDVTVLQKLILEKQLGIDIKTMENQKNLAYTRSAHEAIAAVQRGEFDCTFLINPTKVSEIKDVAMADEKMPKKSMHFWPKLATGIVMNRFEEESCRSLTERMEE